MKYNQYLAIFLFICSFEGFAQDEYVLDIGAEKLTIRLNETKLVKLKDGQSVKVTLSKQEKRKIIGINAEFIPPEGFSVQEGSLNGAIQYVSINALGHGFIMQQYAGLSFEDLEGKIIALLSKQMIDKNKFLKYEYTIKKSDYVTRSGSVLHTLKHVFTKPNRVLYRDLYYGEFNNGGIMIIVSLDNTATLAVKQKLNDFLASIRSL